MNTMIDPIAPMLNLEDKSRTSANVLSPILIIANAASKIPKTPSPAINPDVNNTPFSACSFLSSSFLTFLLSINNLIKPPVMIAVEVLIGKYKPTANGNTGIPKISTTIAMNAPAKTNPQGSDPPITPSIISFINIPCGAGSSSVPYPKDASNNHKIAPITSADTATPINSPICCLYGVAPTKKPVFKSCEVSPEIAAITQITVPIEIAIIIPS